MGPLAAAVRRAASAAGDDDARPLACVASTGSGPARHRKDARLAAVLSEFGWRTHVSAEGEQLNLGDRRLEALAGADLVVCDVVRPDRDLPVELAVAATRGVPVLALVPEGVVLDGMALELLRDCGASILRYARVEPHRVLHSRLVAESAS